MTIMIPAWIDGTLTPVEKVSAHTRGLRHKAISVFILAGDDMLLQQRALGKYHTPGLWANACCTHPHWDEATIDCANRRLEQELGITGVDLQARGTLEYRADVGGGMIEHEVVDVFVAETSRNIVLRPDPDEVMETAWVSRAELPDMVRRNPEKFTPWLRIYLDQYAEQIFAADPVSAIRG